MGNDAETSELLSLAFFSVKQKRSNPHIRNDTPIDKIVSLLIAPEKTIHRQAGNQ